LYYIVSELACY